DDIAKFDEVVSERIRIPKGEALFHQGDRSFAIYGIRSGSIKTQLEDAVGQVQVTGFLLPGEVVGVDGVLNSTQWSNAIALEDPEDWVARIEDLDRVARQVPAVQHQLRRRSGEEINRTQHLVLALGVLRSEQRLAAFLLNL